MRFFRDLTLTGVCLVALLVCFEFGLRLAGAKYTASLYWREAERGYALRPMAEGWMAEEGENYVRINSAGFRDREHELVRPGDTVRIAVLGDSQVVGGQVPIEKSLVPLVERELASCAPLGRRVEALNFAQPGYNLTQIYLTLRRYVWQYQPQIVVEVISTNVSILNNLRELHVGEAPGVPFWVWKDGHLVEDHPAFDAEGARRQAQLFALMNRSRLLLMLNEARNGLSKKLASMRTSAAGPQSKPSNYAAIWPYIPPQDPRMVTAWNTTEALLEKIHDECERHGAELWIVTLDMLMQSTPYETERQEFQRKLGLATLDYSDDRIEAIARRNHIRYIRLAPRMRDYAVRNHVYLHGFFNTKPGSGHWNETGHRAAAQFMAEDLCRGSDQLSPRTAAALKMLQK